MVQAIASQLAQIGINVTIKQEDSATQRDEIGAGTVAPLFLQGLGGPYCDINLIASIGFTEGARYCTWVSPPRPPLRWTLRSAWRFTARCSR